MLMHDYLEGRLELFITKQTLPEKKNINLC